jgi:hypothetical protein
MGVRNALVINYPYSRGTLHCLSQSGHGPLGLDEVGIISSLTKVLADAEISVFVLSTFETDYILVKRMNLEKAAKVLADNGHEIFFD